MEVEVDVLGSNEDSKSTVPNKPTVSVDVKRHFNQLLRSVFTVEK